MCLRPPGWVLRGVRGREVTEAEPSPFEWWAAQEEAARSGATPSRDGNALGPASGRCRFPFDLRSPAVIAPLLAPSLLWVIRFGTRTPQRTRGDRGWDQHAGAPGLPPT